MTYLQEKIQQVKSTIESLEKHLPHADGQQHYKDKRAISLFKEELAYWQKIQRKIGEE